ncbi:MAG: hypothetical protein JTT11_09245 [Candidatus Brockarchaeota archaeon]|nr:hypothetical protein [Candidatus Brockarchaeota archaeon]
MEPSKARSMMCFTNYDIISGCKREKEAGNEAELGGHRRCLLAEDVVKLLVFIAASLPIALKAFRKAYDSTRKDGSLGQY